MKINKILMISILCALMYVESADSSIGFSVGSPGFSVGVGSPFYDSYYSPYYYSPYNYYGYGPSFGWGSGYGRGWGGHGWRHGGRGWGHGRRGGGRRR